MQDYSIIEQKLDQRQFITGNISIGFVISIQFILFPMISEINPSYYSRLFLNYFIFFSLLFVLDIVFTVKNLSISTDYEKHKLLRINIGILAGVFFAHLILLLSEIIKLITTGDIIYENKIVFRYLFVTGLYLFKTKVQMNIFRIFQHTYESIRPME